MSVQTKPLLSIGMIFRDDIRCLERCMKSLAPLREAVPCELVMADTGAMDGSREIAEKYADILFDFPWINDFAAARNAVMDRSSGQWYFTVDCDEWLDGDFSQLVRLLRDGTAGGEKPDTCAVIQRNYSTAKVDGNYADGLAIRLLRMSTGKRYQGAIHEAWDTSDILCHGLTNTILHHDGYVDMPGQSKAAKNERNLKPLRELLEKEPENLRALVEYMDAGGGESDFVERTRYAVALVEQKKPEWDGFGGPILRSAVNAAQDQKLPELEQWIALAHELLPDSFFTGIDVNYFAACHWYDKKDYAACVRAGEGYLKFLSAYRDGRGDQRGLLYGCVCTASPVWEMSVRTMLASAYTQERQPDRAQAMLESVHADMLDGQRAGNLALVLRDYYTLTGRDTEALLRRYWEEIGQNDEARGVFLATAALWFAPDYLKKEPEQEGLLRPAYTMLLPLAEECDLGCAAAILDASSAFEMELLLGNVRKWFDLPAAALARALDHGVRFPLPGRPLKLEEMDALAAGLTAKPEVLRRLVAEAAPAGADGQGLGWVRAITLALVQGCTWENEEEDLALARKFAEVEREFLPRCYAPEVLTEENLFLLPALHRFGFYCARAFEALDGGDPVGCVRQLRAGLAVCESVKGMVEFLVDHMPELNVPPTPSDEMHALAEQIRTVLAQFSPEDPAVAALKQSEAYQKMAWLIEGTQPPVVGGQLQ